MEKIIINIDGGSRGNPGKASFGVVFSKEGSVVKEFCEFIGNATNNEAEYSGLIFALKKAKSLVGKEKIKTTDIEIRSDSELLVNQMNGKYKIINPNIQKLFLEAWNLRIDFPHIKIVSIPREQNMAADRLANQAMDGEEKARTLF